MIPSAREGIFWQLFMILSIVSFRKGMVLIIWLLFMIFTLIKLLDMLAMDMTSFKTFD